MEATSGIDTGKTGDSSTSKRVARPVNSEEKSGYTSLHDAARDNAYKAAAVLLENGADANAEDDKGHTPLHIAAERKAHEAVKVLCRHRERRGWSW